jgi:hypothetical protein
MVSASIERLDLITLQWEEVKEILQEERGSKVFFLILRKAQISFDRLIHSRYVVPWYAEYTIDTLMRWEKLREIEIYPAEDSYNPKCLPSRQSIIPQLPYLRRISIDHFTGRPYPHHNMSILTSLLAYAPNVFFLRIRGNWEPASYDPALKACKYMLAPENHHLPRGGVVSQ